MAELQSLTLNEALNEAARWLTAPDCHKAIDRCDALLSAYPDAVRPLNMRARAHQACGEIARAAQDYARVLEITPADPAAMTGLMVCQSRLGRVADAALTAAQLLDHDPANRDAARLVERAGFQGPGEPGRVLAARTKFIAGLASRAIHELSAVVAQSTDRPDLQVALAELLWRNNQRVATIELCQNILDGQPDCMNAHVLLYALWSRAGAGDLAREHLAALERFDPDFRATGHWLADLTPVRPRDVPALPPLKQPAVSAVNPEEERERAEWVDQLVAGSAPVIAATPVGIAMAAAVPGRHDAAHETAGGEGEGEVNLSAPAIEWSQAEGGGPSLGRSPADEESLPPWLVELQNQAEAAEPGQANAETLPAVEMGAAETPARAKVATAGAVGVVGAAVVTQAVAEEGAAGTDESGEDQRPAGEAFVEAESALESVSPDGAVMTPLEWAPIEPEPEAMDEPAAAPAERPAVAPASPRLRRAQPVKTVKAAKPKRKHQDLLSLARHSLEEARYSESAEYYAQLVKSGKQLDEILADLDVATHAYPDVPQFHMLLGQVYARQGDAPAALRAYRRAMALQG